MGGTKKTSVTPQRLDVGTRSREKSKTLSLAGDGGGNTEGGVVRKEKARASSEMLSRR